MRASRESGGSALLQFSHVGLSSSMKLHPVLKGYTGAAGPDKYRSAQPRIAVFRWVGANISKTLE
jgi:hypothetical protein